MRSRESALAPVSRLVPAPVTVATSTARIEASSSAERHDRVTSMLRRVQRARASRDPLRRNATLSPTGWLWLMEVDIHRLMMSPHARVILQREDFGAGFVITMVCQDYDARWAGPKEKLSRNERPPPGCPAGAVVVLQAVAVKSAVALARRMTYFALLLLIVLPAAGQRYCGF